MVRSFAIIAALATAALLTVGQTQAQPVQADSTAQHHPHHGPHNGHTDFGKVKRQFCDNNQYHCLFLGPAASSSVVLDDHSKPVAQAKSTKSGITIYAMNDGAKGFIDVSCKNGKQGAVAFTLDNMAGSSALISRGKDTLNGIFKSKPGIRLASGKISSREPGDDLNVYCSVDSNEE